MRDCFVGEELVDALVEYLGCARSEAVVLGKQLARKHFIHHVFGQYIDYDAVRQSEEFRRYGNMTEDLHRVNLLELSENEKLAFFLNLYNAMVIHAIVRIGYPEDAIRGQHIP